MTKKKGSYGYRQQRIDGMEVRNATKPVVLEITPKDVKDSKRKDPTGCVAANACLTHMTAVKDVRVHLTKVFILRKNTRVWTRYQTPKSLREEIIAFDRGGTFEPSTFVLSVPKVYRHKPPGPNSVAGKSGNRSAKRRRALRHMIVGVRPHA